MEFSIPPRAARVANRAGSTERWVVYAYLKDEKSPYYYVRDMEDPWLMDPEGSGVAEELYIYPHQGAAGRIAATLQPPLETGDTSKAAE